MAGAVIPCLKYRDAPAAIEWLCRAFGFERHLIVPADDGRIAHAQLRVGAGGMVMLGSVADDDYGRLIVQPDAAGGETQAPYVVVAAIEDHCDRARQAGAAIVMALSEQDHGGKLYVCRDPEGHLWTFGSYDPWG